MMELGPLRQSWVTPARAYCGCCHTERPAHEVQAGLCMDCYDVCWSGEECNLDPDLADVSERAHEETPSRRYRDDLD